eukprot:TRINITY_DN342_c0_g1_i1.p1 TRINITY_DN342_c0_g1~~TRINITY_DN342_c0_g1_i1.p1  ORF type:complete len:750 (-),score=159.89 TRINITY_DN342_c0_g1_i1:11686-13935(-)
MKKNTPPRSLARQRWSRALTLGAPVYTAPQLHRYVQSPCAARAPRSRVASIISSAAWSASFPFPPHFPMAPTTPPVVVKKHTSTTALRSLLAVFQDPSCDDPLISAAAELMSSDPATHTCPPFHHNHADIHVDYEYDAYEDDADDHNEHHHHHEDHNDHNDDHNNNDNDDDDDDDDDGDDDIDDQHSFSSRSPNGSLHHLHHLNLAVRDPQPAPKAMKPNTTTLNPHSQSHSQSQSQSPQPLARSLPTRNPDAMQSTAEQSLSPSPTPARSSQSSHAAFVFSQAWYQQMSLEAIPLSFRVPHDVMQPSFFRVSCAQHNALFPPESSSPNALGTHTAEANVLYQVLAFLQENLNQLFDAHDEFAQLDGVDASDSAMMQLLSAWKHLRGTTEMLQCRYDLLCGYRQRDFRQTALLEAHMTPALGSSALAQAVHADVRGVGADAAQAREHTREQFYDAEFSWKPGEREHDQQGQTQLQAQRDGDDGAQSVARKSERKSKKRANRTVTWADRQSSSTEFVFVLRRYDLIGASVVRGAWHVFGGFLWRLLIMPNKDKGLEGYLWVYLQCGGSCDVGDSDEDDEGEEEHELHEHEHEEEEHDENAQLQQGETEAAGPSDKHEDAEEEEEEDGDERDDARVMWCRPTQFTMRIVHSTSPLARAAVRSGREMFDSVETVEQSQWFRECDEASLYPDIKRHEYHVFRSSSDDWGFEIAKFCTLQPGLYADNDMNVVFVVRIMLLSFDQPLPPLEGGVR